MSDDGFLSRWAQRKTDVRSGKPVVAEATPVVPLPAAPALAPLAEAVAQTPPATSLLEATVEVPPLTLDDVAALVPGDEISRFVAAGADEHVKRAAIKKLFTDPHYNIMDGLDTYIDDYSLPDPIPMAMLRQMNQSKFLGLFAEEEAAEARAAAELAAAQRNTPPSERPHLPGDAAPIDQPAPLAPDADPVTVPKVAAVVPQHPDEDPDLQLQPDDAARRPGAREGAGSERH